MSAEMEAAPRITNAGTEPRTTRKLFVNVAVSDLQRAITFFEALGFVFNTQFTDSTATCMIVGADAYFLLVTKERFATCVRKPAGDAHFHASAFFAITCESRDEVDALYAKALGAGGTAAAEPEDHGFMYMRSFHDLDGHHWELFWMDPAAING